MAAAFACLVACQPASKDPAAETTTQARFERWWELDSPVGDSSFAPSLHWVEGDLLLGWLEKTETESGAAHHQFLVARHGPEGWTKPAVVAAGDDFFANWADIPKIVAMGDGALLAHWLAKTDEETYAYSIFMARSEDGGVRWEPLGTLNDDGTPTEHGFVSYAPAGDSVRAFWLDGREMATGGDMTLRTALVGRDIGPSEVLDDRVCECCATGATHTATGPVVVYRDRSADEIRDIGIVRRVGESWTSTALVASDEWRIEGCPVNGPEVAASGETLAVVWYTAGGDRPKVQLALSGDSGESFAAPQAVDDGRPLGRGDIVDDGEGGFVLSWLEGADQDAEIRLRRVDGDGDLGRPVVVARTSPARASGFPKLIRIGETCFLAWVDVDGTDASQIRILEIPLSAIG